MLHVLLGLNCWQVINVEDIIAKVAFQLVFYVYSLSLQLFQMNVEISEHGARGANWHFWFQDKNKHKARGKKKEEKKKCPDFLHPDFVK